jgi:alpha-beta hydrolase superfamily lysophospholipase
MDFNIELNNGQILKGIIRSPGENAGALILFVHGLGEHLQRYSHWSDLFAGENIAFAGLDLPGHGRSEGKRGSIRSYSVLDEMIDILLKTATRTFPGVPVYLYGHSLGGGIVLDYILRRNPKIRGAIITSPWLRLSFEPARIKTILASAAGKVVPGFVQPSGLNTMHLSHDESVVERYNNDPLVHNKISLSLFTAAINAARNSLRNASSLKIQTLIIHGSDDLICSPAGSREFAMKTQMAELKIWEGGFHELHNEPFKEDVFKYIVNWIKKPRSSNKP